MRKKRKGEVGNKEEEAREKGGQRRDEKEGILTIAKPFPSTRQYDAAMDIIPSLK